MLSSDRRPGLPEDLITSVFQQKNLYAFLHDFDIIFRLLALLLFDAGTKLECSY
jgi:hypothetical protein